MEGFTTFAALVVIAGHLTALIKYLSAGQFREAVTGLVPIVGLGLVLLVAADANAMAGVVIPGLDTPLRDLDVGSLILVAIAGGSGAAQLFNWRKATDNTTSSAEPPLGGRPEV